MRNGNLSLHVAFFAQLATSSGITPPMAAGILPLAGGFFATSRLPPLGTWSRRLGMSIETAPNKLLQGCKVLIAEDEPFVAFDILKTLHEAGAEILGPALSLARALELASSEHFDCAVLDVMLGDGSIFPAAKLLQQNGAGLVFYSGRLGLACLKQALPGAQVLLKPASPKLLVAAVRAACSP